MIETLYIEADIADHPRTRQAEARFPNARRIIVERYGEVFNRKAQNFRLQKQNPALIIAKKPKGFVHPTPENYGVGGEQNYYFSHMLNCVYDCRYCFLQGMYRSAHYVWFVNYEDFQQEIKQIATNAGDQAVYFFSGYDCDSLALDPVTQFVDAFLPVFREQSNAWLELRTKSTQVRGLLAQDPLQNVVVAFSLSPENIVDALEHKTPDLNRRLQAAAKLQAKGWPIGLRFDPVIYHADYKQHYAALFELVFSVLDAESLHSVSLGAFRMPPGFFQPMVKLYPKEALFASALSENDQGLVSYPVEIEQAMMAFCRDQILMHVAKERFFPCY